MITERARAKINLTLHVGPPITKPAHPHQGYHPLSSLVAFASIADELRVEESKPPLLRIDGRFGSGLPTDEKNLILKVYRAVARRVKVPVLGFRLTKNLPVAAGIGGGSANAAAALRILRSYVKLPDADWHAVALEAGADVPVCMLSRTAQMKGIGEDIRPIPGIGTVPAVLVNPGVPVSTAAIFNAFDRDPNSSLSEPPSTGDLITRTLSGTNNLERHAILQAPVIMDVLRSLGSQTGCAVARMSGSGATCFGLFTRVAQAETASQMIKKAHPGWWVVPTLLGDPERVAH